MNWSTIPVGPSAVLSLRPWWNWCKVTTFSSSAQIIQQLFSADFQSSERYWAIMSDIERYWAILHFTPKAPPNPNSQSPLLLEQFVELHRTIFVHRYGMCVHKSTPVFSESSRVDSIRYGVICIEKSSTIYSMHRENIAIVMHLYI